MADYDPTAKPAGGDLSTYQSYNDPISSHERQIAVNDQRGAVSSHGSESGGSWGGSQGSGSNRS